MAIRLSAEHARRLGGFSFSGARHGRKFNNKPTTYDSPVVGSYKHPSIWQAEVCQNLDMMVRANQIKTFIIEIPLRLKAQTDKGKTRIMRVDFMLIDNDGRCHWWDAKGKETSEWMLKRDLVWQQYQIDVQLVKRGKRLPQIYEDENCY